jgi:hypothetical protein
MQFGRIFDIFMGIVAVAGAVVVVSSKNTAAIIKSWGDTFSGSIRAAEGR